MIFIFECGFIRWYVSTFLELKKSVLELVELVRHQFLISNYLFYYSSYITEQFPIPSRRKPVIFGMFIFEDDGFRSGTPGISPQPSGDFTV